jgi:hypothetical protein
LRHGHKRDVAKVFEPPQPFTAAFNPLADQSRNAGTLSHVPSIGFKGITRQVFLQ